MNSRRVEPLEYEGRSDYPRREIGRLILTYVTAFFTLLGAMVGLAALVWWIIRQVVFFG